MMSVTVDDLLQEFSRVEQLLAQGEEIEITRQGKTLGRIVPERSVEEEIVEDRKERPPLPDFLGRIRAVYGDEMLPVTGAEIVRMDRDRY